METCDRHGESNFNQVGMAKVIGLAVGLVVVFILVTGCQIPPANSTAPPTPCTVTGQKQVDKDGMTLLCVPAGEFLMGAADADKDGSPIEKPQHQVTLDAFWIDQTEVTNGMYQQCVQAGKCNKPSSDTSLNRKSYYGNSQYANYPVVFVSWEDAKSYCAWARRRMPTEAEWEKAARGADGRLYPWGNQAPDSTLANFGNYPQGDTKAAGSFPMGASPYGALDMAGNVWEWTLDWFGGNYYASSPSSNPTGPSSGEVYVLRGGGWYEYSKYLRTAFRGRGNPGGKNDVIGFRCVR